VLGEDHGGRPVKQMGELGVGQVDQEREHQDQVNEVGDVPMGHHSQIVQHFSNEAADHDREERPEEDPVKVGADTGIVPIVEMVSNHENTADQHRSAADVCQQFPGAPETEWVDKSVTNQGIIRTRDHPECDYA
jgi:hypothetical protein